jgi:hypothetical protein
VYVVLIVTWKFVGNWDNRDFTIKVYRFVALPFTFLVLFQCTRYNELAFISFTVDARGREMIVLQNVLFNCIKL